MTSDRIAKEDFVTAAIATAGSGYQPVDSDLTAIAALTTTSYGRALLELANAAAGLTAFGLDADLATLSLPASTTISAFGASLVDDAAASNARTTLGLGTAAVAATGDFDAAGAAAAAQAASQPLDSDLTAIAALSTTSYGRAFLALANAAAGISALGLDADIATLVLPASTTISAFGATVVDDADASAARMTLGLVIGTDVQAQDADLSTIAGLTATTDNMIQSVGSAWASRTPAQLKATLALAKADVGLGNVDNTADTAKPVSTAQQTALDLKANLASPTFTGTVTIPDGSGVTDAASFGQVTNLINGRPVKLECRASTTAALPAVVYANGSSGVGATLTGVSVGAIGAMDGITLAVNDRLLVKNQVAQEQNGAYSVTATGSGIAVFILTRVTDSDQAADLQNGASYYIVLGTTLADTTWALSNDPQITITVGTTALTFAQVDGAGSTAAGNGLSRTGNTLSIDTAITVDKTTAQTLTNKTLTAPVVNSPTGIVKADVGLGNVDDTSNATERAATATLTNKTLTSPAITTPTGIVKGDVGLGNVDNTSNATERAATATLTNKTLTAPVVNSPTGIVKADVGLGNVDNTADSAKTFAGEAITSGTVADARIASTIARDSEVAAGYQPLDADLTTIAGLTPTTNNFLVANASAWASRTPAQAIAHLGLDADLATLSLPASTTISAFGATIVDDANAAATIATLGLDADLATLALPASTTISAFGATLVDDAAATNARTTLGLVIGTDVAAIASPVFTGTPAAPTPDFNDASTALATTQYVDRLTTWETWTPQIDQGATTNIAKTVAYASYVALGKLVMGQVRLTLTAAGTAGSSITISAPIAASASANLQVGTGAFFDASASLFYRILARYTAATDVFEFNRCDATANTLIGVDPNVALASGDIILLNFFYQIP